MLLSSMKSVDEHAAKDQGLQQKKVKLLLADLQYKKQELEIKEKQELQVAWYNQFVYIQDLTRFYHQLHYKYGWDVERIRHLHPELSTLCDTDEEYSNISKNNNNNNNNDKQKNSLQLN